MTRSVLCTAAINSLPLYSHPASSIKVHFPCLSRACRWDKEQCTTSRKWVSKLSPCFLCVFQCGRWCSRQRGGRLCGLWRRLQLCPSDPRRRRRAGSRAPGQPAVRTHLPAGPPAATQTEAPALAVYTPQAGRGGSHQALSLPVWELWALVRPTGQAGETGAAETVLTADTM